jgi:hypothetical protein
MIRIQVGLFLAVTFLCSLAQAQIAGEVESIGFGNTYRPACWTPMVVRLRPGSNDTGTYQIQVIQEDLDRDRAIFVRPITLTGNGRDQRFWCYFQPQSTVNKYDSTEFHGLPDVTQGGNLKQLQQALKVYLCTSSGKQLAQLPITPAIANIEATNTKRGVKLILFVTDGSAIPNYREYEDPNTAGIVEEVAFVTVKPWELPEDVRGFDAIDGIVWSSATPPDPSIAADEPRYRAIQQYVRAGGKLVICQPMEWQRALLWGDMLPVNYPKFGDSQGVERKADLAPLNELAHAPSTQPPVARRDEPLSTNAEKALNQLTAPKDANAPIRDGWAIPQGPFTFGLAEAKPDARVDEPMIDWGNKMKTPWLVRRPYGCGETIWVAQDLGDPTITRSARTGWTYVWDKVFDWKNDEKFYTSTTPEADKRDYASAFGTDLGASLLRGMEQGETMAWLIGVAVTFFIGYWLLAGPGSYFYLARVKKASMSWVAFAAAAIAATLLTLLVVKLVLRGAPKLQHVTLMRMGPTGPAVAFSRIGLYVKQDAVMNLELRDTVPDSVSYVAPYPIHPGHVNENASEFAANLQYEVPVREPGAPDATLLKMPFRSTMKKLETRWTGDVTPRVSGSNLALSDDPKHGHISGKITNNTGKLLRNIYIAYNTPEFGETRDIIVYIPSMADGTSIDLGAKDFPVQKVDRTPDPNNKFIGRPEDNMRVWGYLGTGHAEGDWERYWDTPMRNENVTALSDIVRVDDLANPIPHSFPELSFFERLGPVKNLNGGYGKENRFERMRRGAREWDMSQSIAAGDVVVIAQSDDAPLPYPFVVDGDVTGGKGTVFYQFSLALDRSALAPPATQPSARIEDRNQKAEVRMEETRAGVR